MAHKDLSDDARAEMEGEAEFNAQMIYRAGQSLALAREAWINAFDKAAEEMEADNGKAQA